MVENRAVPSTPPSSLGLTAASVPVPTRSPRPHALDAVAAAAVESARSAAEELAGADAVGEHLGVSAEGERLVSHSFRCEQRGYRGWRWAVSLARAPRSRVATVCEVVLLPDDGSVLAPAWVPWADRIVPGDLGPRDVLPYRPDDENLEPGYTATGDEDADRMALWELGLGRVRVLAPEGRDAAAQRWYTGDRGPTAEEAVTAAAACASCGYFVSISGSLRLAFGVCANEWSPADGRVVSVDHGCGAHSETDVEHAGPEAPPELILDDDTVEAVPLPRHEAVEQGTGSDVAAEPAPAGGKDQDATA
jgi:hypothetical protein